MKLRGFGSFVARGLFALLLVIPLTAHAGIITSTFTLGNASTDDDCVSVDLRIQVAEPIQGFAVSFNWDPSIAEFLSVDLADEPGEFLSFFDAVDSNEFFSSAFVEGIINGQQPQFVPASIDPGSLGVEPGEYRVATYTFGRVNEGTTPLEFGSGNDLIGGGPVVIVQGRGVAANTVPGSITFRARMNNGIVPEPGAALVFGAGLLVVAGALRRQP